MSLATPEKLKGLQRALYSKAKREPQVRFHFLYDKVWRSDVLEHAYKSNRAKGGAPGVDGQTFAMIEAYGVRRWLAELQEELRRETYKPSPVRRVMIPKPSGVGERPLGIPIIRDRVVQMAVKLVTEPGELLSVRQRSARAAKAGSFCRRPHAVLPRAKGQALDAWDVSVFLGVRLWGARRRVALQTSSSWSVNARCESRPRAG